MQHVRIPWRSGTGWRLVLVFGLMGSIFYGLNSWLPDAYVEHGWTKSSAGGLLAALNIAALVPPLLVSWFADRIGSRRVYLVAGCGLLIGGTLGLVIALVIGVVNFFVIPSEVGKMFKKDGQPAPVSGWTGLWVLLPLAGVIIWFVKVQGSLNRYWRGKRGQTAAV